MFLGGIPHAFHQEVEWLSDTFDENLTEGWVKTNCIIAHFSLFRQPEVAQPDPNLLMGQLHTCLHFKTNES